MPEHHTDAADGQDGVAMERFAAAARFYEREPTAASVATTCKNYVQILTSPFAGLALLSNFRLLPLQ